MHLSVRNRIILLTIVPVVLVYAVVFSLYVARINTVTEREQERLLTTQARGLAAQFDGQLQQVSRIADTTASFVAGSPLVSEAQLYAQLEANVRLDPLVYGAAIAWAPGAWDGRRLFSPYVCEDGAGAVRTLDIGDLAGGTGYDYTGEAWWAIPFATGEPVWTEPYFDEGAGEIWMSVRDGRLETGEGQMPVADVTFELGHGDLLAVLGGASNPDLLFMDERIRVEGELSLALKLRKLFRAPA